jgi:hypothetical protein
MLGTVWIIDYHTIWPLTSIAKICMYVLTYWQNDKFVKTWEQIYSTISYMLRSWCLLFGNMQN